MAAKWTPIKVPKIPTAAKKAPKVQPVAQLAQPIVPAAPVPTPAQRLASNPDAWKDSSYHTGLAGLQAQKAQGLAALDTQAARSREDTDRNRELLAEGLGKARVSTRNQSNKQGLLFSGILGKRLGEVDTDFGRRQSDLALSFARGEEDRAASRAGLESAYQQGERQYGDDAMARFIAQGEQAAVPELPGQGGPSLAELMALFAPQPAAKKPAAKKGKK